MSKSMKIKLNTSTQLIQRYILYLQLICYLSYCSYLAFKWLNPCLPWCRRCQKIEVLNCGPRFRPQYQLKYGSMIIGELLVLSNFWKVRSRQVHNVQGRNHQQFCQRVQPWKSLLQLLSNLLLLLFPNKTIFQLWIKYLKSLIFQQE